MRWVDNIDDQLGGSAFVDYEAFSDIRDLIAAIRIMETALEEVASVNYCDGINHKITHDVAVLALQRANAIRNQ